MHRDLHGPSHSDQERLARVETEVGFLKEMFSEVKSALLQVADDMHKLAVLEAERAEDRRTIKRVFEQIRAVNDVAGQLDKRITDLATNVGAAETRRIENELKERNRWLWELSRTGLAVAVALGLAKMGVHLV
jgi:septal ring factor EnvC (AmiA/AmiB activator)